MHFVDALVHMPVSTEPRFIINGIFDLVEPTLGAVIHSALVNEGKKHLGRLILIGAGVGQDNVHFMNGKLLGRIGFDFLGRLLIWPPAIVSTESVILINAVGTADNKVAKSFQRKDFLRLLRRADWDTFPHTKPCRRSTPSSDRKGAWPGAFRGFREYRGSWASIGSKPASDPCRSCLDSNWHPHHREERPCLSRSACIHGRMRLAHDGSHVYLLYSKSSFLLLV